MQPKYSPLEGHLNGISYNVRDVTFSFAEIERIIGATLPKSAYQYREWWSNQADVSMRPQAKAWVRAGFVVDQVQQQPHCGSVRFKRR